jgi:hypothetical protein
MATTAVEPAPVVNVASNGIVISDDVSDRPPAPEPEPEQPVRTTAAIRTANAPAVVERTLAGVTRG